VFELVAVMKLRVIGGSVEPHFVDDFKPAVTESAQRVGVALVLLTVMVIVNVGPGTTRQTVLGEKMDGVPEVFVTSPALKTVAAFSGTFSDRGSSTKALQILSIATKALPIVANLGEQAGSDLGSGTRQGPKQIMIGMRSEKLLDSPAIEAELLFDRKKHLH
jgi:hypothetical protein